MMLKPVFNVFTQNQGVQTLVYKRAYLLVLAIAITCGLSGCRSDEQAELKTWMQNERAKTPATIKPIPKPLPFSAAEYLESGDEHPFNSDKLREAMIKVRSNSNNKQFEPDLSRKREVLESFPIDTIRMLGVMMSAGKSASKGAAGSSDFKDTQPVAQVMAGQQLHNVRVGQYIGTDFGRVTAVTETAIVLSERVQDSAGIWAERNSKIPLNVAPGKENK